MKTVLIYGDSNTFGETAFAKKPRLGMDERWAGIVAGRLSGKAQIIAEGFSGRSAGDLQVGRKGHANGHQHFPTIYGSHKPIDVLVIALGTNDCKIRFNRMVNEIMGDLRGYEQQTRRENKLDAHAPNPHVIFITPPNFEDTNYDDPYFYGRMMLRNNLVEQMEHESSMETLRIDEIDLTEDGVHFSLTGHQQMADNVYEKLKEMV